MLYTGLFVVKINLHNTPIYKLLTATASRRGGGAAAALAPTWHGRDIQLSPHEYRRKSHIVWCSTAVQQLYLQRDWIDCALSCDDRMRGWHFQIGMFHVFCRMSNV